VDKARRIVCHRHGPAAQSQAKVYRAAAALGAIRAASPSCDGDREARASTEKADRRSGLLSRLIRVQKVIDDYLDYQQLLDLDIDPDEADALLAASGLTGNDGRRVIEADRLPKLLQELRERRRP
jgi:hypothetical protein